MTSKLERLKKVMLEQEGEVFGDNIDKLIAILQKIKELVLV